MSTLSCRFDFVRLFTLAKGDANMTVFRYHMIGKIIKYILVSLF